MHTNAPTDHEAILLVAFGTTTEIGQDVYQKLEDEVREKYPKTELLWAYTSEPLRQDLADHGIQVDSVNGALHKLDERGVTRVIVLPLYVVSGGAYQSLAGELEVTLPLSHLKHYSLAAPLLHEARDADVVSTALLESLPEEEECPEKILFMGHGSSNEVGNAAYTDVDDLLDRTYPGARLALLSGDSFEELLAEWGDAREEEQVLLRPFFFTIGHHSLRDLGGRTPESWKTRLESMGYDCTLELISLGELPAVRELLMEHLERAYKSRHSC